MTPRHPYAKRIDPRTENGEQRRQNSERCHHVHKDGSHPAKPHGAQEVLREEQQRRERYRHRHTGEGHRASRRCHRPGQCDFDTVSSTASRLELLAESADDEEGVVDSQTEAHHRHDVDGEDRHVTEKGQNAEQGKGAQDRQTADRERKAGCGQAPEHQDEQHHEDRQRQRLRLADVLLHLGSDLGVDRDVAPAQRGQPRGFEVVCDPLVGRVRAAGRVVGEMQHCVRRVPIPRDKLRSLTGRPVRRDSPDVCSGQAGKSALYGVTERGVVDR